MEETLEILQDNLGQALIDTAYMVVVSAIIGVVLGTLVALLLYLTENRLFTPNHCGCGIPSGLAVVHSWCGAHHYFTDWLFRNGRNDRRWRHRRYGHSIRL